MRLLLFRYRSPVINNLPLSTKSAPASVFVQSSVRGLNKSISQTYQIAIHVKIFTLRNLYRLLEGKIMCLLIYLLSHLSNKYIESYPLDEFYKAFPALTQIRSLNI
jgi:hypothetical protein